jgi:hypothetical protein
MDVATRTSVDNGSSPSRDLPGDGDDLAPSSAPELGDNNLMNTSNPHQLTLRSRLRAAAQEVRHLHQLERAGESEWTPWIALAGLILLFASIGMLMFGIVDAASHLPPAT